MAAAAILNCRIHKISLADSVRRAQTHHCTKFRQNRSFHCGGITISRIFIMVAAAILDFWNPEILLPIVVERVETHQHAIFRQNRSIGCEDIKIFQFFKMAAAAILDFRNREFLFADGIWRTQTHHYTKFCGWSKMTGSQGFSLTTPMAVNTGLAQLRRLWSLIKFLHFQSMLPLVLIPKVWCLCAHLCL